MLHFPSSSQNKSEDTIVNAWQWAQYNSEECEQWPLGKLYSDFTFDLFSQEQYSLNKVTPVGDWCVLVCWLLRQFLKSSRLQSRKNNRKLDIWAPPSPWVSHRRAEEVPIFWAGSLVDGCPLSREACLHFTPVKVWWMWMSPLLGPATTTLPSHIPIARDTTRGSHYDNTGPLEITKIQARQTAGGRSASPLIVVST